MIIIHDISLKYNKLELALIKCLVKFIIFRLYKMWIDDFTPYHHYKHLINQSTQLLIIISDTINNWYSQCFVFLLLNSLSFADCLPDSVCLWVVMDSGVRYSLASGCRLIMCRIFCNGPICCCINTRFSYGNLHTHNHI